jgi:hypothetical protein
MRADEKDLHGFSRAAGPAGHRCRGGDPSRLVGGVFDYQEQVLDMPDLGQDGVQNLRGTFPRVAGEHHGKDTKLTGNGCESG